MYPLICHSLFICTHPLRTFVELTLVIVVAQNDPEKTVPNMFLQGTDVVVTRVQICFTRLRGDIADVHLKRTARMDCTKQIPHQQVRRDQVGVEHIMVVPTMKPACAGSGQLRQRE